MHRLRVLFGLFPAVLVLTLLLGSSADAGKSIQWCVKDPIFEVDGRVVRVIDLVPIEDVDAPLHFVLVVARSAQATWRLPEGETLTGTVTIVKARDVSRDTARLYVRGEGSAFPMRLQVSGAGLRSPAFEIAGSSRGMVVPLRLVSLAHDDDD